MSTDAHPTTDATSTANGTAAPAANGAPSPKEVAPAAQRTRDELLQELIELGKQFPEPERGDDIPDARWFQTNETALCEQYLGEHVAILNGAVVGHHWDELQLRLDVARQYNVHPYRALVVHLFTIFE